MRKEICSADREGKIEALVDQAAVLFAEKGYCQCGVQDLIHVLGLSKGGFYWYFSSKEDLYRKICRIHCRRNREAFLGIMGRDLSDWPAVYQATQDLLQWYLDNPDHIRLMVDFIHESGHEGIRKELEELHREWLNILMPVLRHLVDGGLVRSGGDATFLAEQCIIFFQGLLFYYHVHRRKAVVMKQWERFLTRVLLGGEGREDPSCRPVSVDDAARARQRGERSVASRRGNR